MEEMGEVAVTIHDDVKTRTEALEAAVYAALEACDAYRDTVVGHLDELGRLDGPSEMVVKRLRQFQARAEAMIRIIEDDVLDELLFCIDRLAMFDLAERGRFI